VLVAHGTSDAELSLTAGELLRDFAVAGGAQVTWLPFDGGHELPLVVWRALRTQLKALAQQAQQE
jgi:phospholipase/carboxylesterase